MIDVVKHQFKLMFLALPFLIVYLFDEIRTNICFIIILVSLIIVFERFNEFVVHQYINKKNQSCTLQLLLILFSIIASFLICISPYTKSYWLLDDSFFALNKNSEGFWNTIAAAILMDFVFKLGTVSVKTSLIFIRYCNYKFKQKYMILDGMFYAIETLMQLLRCLIITPQWIKYSICFSHAWISVKIICTLGYCIGKAFFLWNKIQLVYNIPTTLRKSKAYSVLESQGYAEHEINQTCPKCEEKIPLNEVIKINCSKLHAMCKTCASIWFARFPMCPLCKSSFECKKLIEIFKPSLQPIKEPVHLTKIINLWKTGITDSLNTFL